VQAGDTLEQISVKTGIPLDRLISLNPTIDATALHIGEKIRLHR
jgi:LysM repeat protein